MFSFRISAISVTWLGLFSYLFHGALATRGKRSSDSLLTHSARLRGGRSRRTHEEERFNPLKGIDIDDLDGQRHSTGSTSLPASFHWASNEKEFFTSTTVTTTTTMFEGPSFLLISTSNPPAIYSWDLRTSKPDVLLEFAGSDPSGIAIDRNRGYLYFTDPKSRQIVQYALAIRNDRVVLYDDQPVIVAQNVDAEFLTVNTFGNLFWTDPVNKSIKKMYLDTIEVVQTGKFQPDKLQVVTYKEVYTSLGKQVPSNCYGQQDFPPNCSMNATCRACKHLGRMPYIYQLYSDMGHPAGMQVMPGNKLLWGNMVDGFSRGTVVEAQAEPVFEAHKAAFPAPKPRTFLWNSVFNFIQLPNDPIGQDLLYLTTNGTVGKPPIPGDVKGAVVSINLDKSHGPITATPVDWNFQRPRSLAWDGKEMLYIADERGVLYIAPSMPESPSPEIVAFSLPNSSGLTMVRNDFPCYPVMVDRGLAPVPRRMR